MHVPPLRQEKVQHTFTEPAQVLPVMLPGQLHLKLSTKSMQFPLWQGLDEQSFALTEQVAFVKPLRQRQSNPNPSSLLMQVPPFRHG